MEEKVDRGEAINLLVFKLLVQSSSFSLQGLNLGLQAKA